MTSFRFHAGRLHISDNSGQWMAKIKVKGEELELKLCGKNAQASILEAEQLYADLQALSTTRPYCWQCIHWSPVKSECSLGFPEGKSSGGRFASQCSCLWIKD